MGWKLPAAVSARRPILIGGSGSSKKFTRSQLDLCLVEKDGRTEVRNGSLTVEKRHKTLTIKHFLKIYHFLNIATYRLTIYTGLIGTDLEKRT